MTDQTGAKRLPRLPGSRRARTLVGPVGLSLALLGSGVGAGFFDSANAAPTPAAAVNSAQVPQNTTVTSTQIIQVTNLTPFTWNLSLAREIEEHWNAFPPAPVRWELVARHAWPATVQLPPATIAPGQTIVFSNFTQNVDVGNGEQDVIFPEVYYRFTDDQGVSHQAQFDVNSGFTPVGFVGGLSTWSEDANGNVDNSKFHFVDTGNLPNGDSYSTAAIWTGNGTVNIDAVQNPDAAGAIVQGLFSQIPQQDLTDPNSPYHVTWTPTSAPAVTVSADKRVSSIVRNYTSSPVNLSFGQSQLLGQSTNLGASVSASVGVKVVAVAASVTATVDVSHDWTSSDSVGFNASGNIDPNSQGWIETDQSEGTVTGDLSFTYTDSQGPVTYKLTNVTVNQDVLPKSVDGPPSQGYGFSGDQPAPPQNSAPGDPTTGTGN